MKKKSTKGTNQIEPTKENIKNKTIDFSTPGFSNVAPDSPQATPFKRTEILPSQINKLKD